MTTRVYSQQLVAGAVFGIGSLTWLVPDGTLAVIRSIDVWCLGPKGYCHQGFDVSSTTFGQFWGCTPYSSWGERSYQWRGRQVLNAGDELVFSSYDSAPFDAVVSGYLFTLP